MRRTAGTALLTLALLWVATLALASPAQGGTSTPATTAGPAPDPKPPPPVKPDPKPRPPAPPPAPPAPPPAPPAPPPTSAPQPTAPQPTAPATVAVAPPPPPPSVTAPSQQEKAAPAATRPKRSYARTTRARPPDKTNTPASSGGEAPLQVLAPPTRSATDLEETGVAASSGVLALVVSLFVLGLALVFVSILPPARVPWPIASDSLYFHRSGLTVVGIGTIALGLLCLNAAVLL